MTYQEALDRLSNHANQPSRDDMSPEESFIFHLWHADRNKVFPDVKEFIQDLLKCLEVVNKHLNGTKPSTSVKKEERIELDLLQNISSIIASSQEYLLLWQKNSIFTQAERNELMRIIWQISFAWDAILNGDIDSLTEEIKLQRQTKEI